MASKSTETTGAASSAAAATNNDQDIKSPTSKYIVANLNSKCFDQINLLSNSVFVL